MKTNVYIDGFNLYYRLKGTPYRWLNIAKLCEVMLPENEIHRIRYFTARVSDTPDNPQLSLRQQVYLRALQTIPNLTIHYGQFLRNRVRMPLVNPRPNGPRTAEVWKTEEKGSDVNIACYMLLDAFKGEYEVAVVISNDSDLKEPIEIVRKEFDLRVVVLHPVRPPQPRQKLPISVELRRVATKSLVIEDHHLAQSQFPPQLVDQHGIITKPEKW